MLNRNGSIVLGVLLIFGGVGCQTFRGGNSGSNGPITTHDGMVWVSSGEFTLGSSENDGMVGIEIGVDELPQQEVFLSGFLIDRFEVTNRDYERFREATGHPPSALLTQEEFTSVYPEPEPDHPVIDVNWFDAHAYCQWAEKRLPTEAEWEKAARGTDGRFWPWGNQGDPRNTNTWESRRFWTTPVGSIPEDVSPYGVFDMGGNAMEWTDSWYQSYPGSSLKRTAFGKAFKVLKGASWGTAFNPFSRTSHRHAVLPQLAQPDFGFRCAKDGE